MLQLLWLFLLMLINSCDAYIADGNTCTYGNGFCAVAFKFDSCNPGSKCVNSKDQNLFCGDIYRCVNDAPPTPKPTKKPTVPPTVKVVGKDEICALDERDEYTDCDTLGETAYLCDEGLECTGALKQRCGTYKVCADAPTPEPTPAPTEAGRVEGNECCPVEDHKDCSSWARFHKWHCVSTLDCVRVYNNRYGRPFVCMAPPPTPKPTPSPSPAPTESYRPRAEGDICHNCGTGESWMDMCPGNTYCYPSDDKFCKWHCQNGLEVLDRVIPSTGANEYKVMDGTHSSTDYYKSAIRLSGGVYFLANPEKDKVEVWYDGALLRTLTAGGDSELGYSMDEYQDWVIVGMPGRSGVNVYKKVQSGPTYNIYLSHSFTFTADKRCGEKVAFSHGGEFFMVTCPESNTMHYYKRTSSSHWAHAVSVDSRIIFDNDFGRGLSSTDDYSAVGQRGSVLLVQTDTYVFDRKRSFSFLGPNYFRIIKPTVSDDGFGHSVVLNAAGKYMMVGTGTNKYYRYDWDGKYSATNERIYYLGDHPLEFESYVIDSLSFARSNHKAVIFNDADEHEHIVGGEFGPPFSDPLTYNVPVSISHVSNSRMVFTRGKKVSYINVGATKRPTARPTDSPTKSPTPQPTRGPYFDYVQRNGRACGRSQSLINTVTKVRNSYVCELQCTLISDCRCFDYKDNTCTYYRAYDSDIEWTAGDTHSFIKKSENVMNLKMVLYVINKDGELVENEDVRSQFGFDLSHINVHTTEGEIGIIWRHKPIAFTQPSDLPEGVYKHIPRLSNNPYVTHPATYDGYLSVIGSKILQIDYDFDFTTNHAHAGVQYLVTIELEDSRGETVFYNSHRYTKPDESLECPPGGVIYKVGQDPTTDCPAGMINFIINGYKCNTFLPKEIELWVDVKASVTYRNDGFITANQPWSHCQFYETPDDKYRKKRVSSQFTSTQRADTRSHFTLTPADNDIQWSVYGSHDVPDPAIEPVTVRIRNFQDGSPLVISDIILKDHAGRFIRKLTGEDITVTGDDASKRFIDTDYSCPISSTSLIQNCPTFGDGGPCCGHNPDYSTAYRFSCADAVSYKVVSYPNPPGPSKYPCGDICNDDVKCVGYEMSSSDWITEHCKLYSKVTKVKNCDPLDPPGYKYKMIRVALTKSSRFHPVPTLVTAHNQITEEKFGCLHDRVVADVEVTSSGNQFEWCASQNGVIPNSEPGSPGYNPPVRVKVDSYATIEFQVDGREVEYIDIGAGATVGDDPSSYTYELIHHGVVMNTGVFSSTNEKANRRSILVKNAGDTDEFEMFSNQYRSEFLTLYDMFCNDESSEAWYESHSIYTILQFGGITVLDLCLDLEGAYSTRNPSIFNDAAYTFRNDIEQTLNALDFLDGTKDSFMEYETSNSNYPASVDTVKAAIDFLIGVDKMFDCGNTTETKHLAVMDTEYLAETLMLEYTFPSRYRSWCDNLKYAEDMKYKGQVYNIGRAGAPCISNAMCHDDFVCADYYCSHTNDTKVSICPATQTTIHPLYYGVKPKNNDAHACAISEVYHTDGLGAFSFETGAVEDPVPYGRPGYKFIEYDQYFANTCSAGFDWVAVKEDHFKNRGSFQQCGNYYTSEIMDVGVGLQSSEFGRTHCFNPTFTQIISQAISKSGEYDRIVPRKVALGNRDIDYFRRPESKSPNKVLPASFALSNGDEMGMLGDLLDAQCRFPDVDDLSFTGQGINNEIQCADVDGCVWSDSLRQCVASRLNVEANFCPIVSDEDQCKLTGFCAWNDDDDGCYHPTAQDYEYDPRRNKENECEIIFDPIACGRASCIWDLVQQTCNANWDDVVIYNDELLNSGVEGSSDSLNSPKIKMYNNNKRAVGGMKSWPACSAPGKLFLGHQISGGKWTYYPEPAADTFIVGYEQNTVGVGMLYGTWTLRHTDNRVVYSKDFPAWDRREVEKDGATTNKLCFKKDILYDKEMCEGYGFKWGKNNLCWLDDDGHIGSVQSLIAIAAPIIYWDLPFLYEVGKTPQKNWDVMVADHFDDNDWEDVKLHEKKTYHGYPYLRLGCYTKINKAQCENTDGYEQTRRVLGVDYIQEDRRCLWLPRVQSCIPRSSKSHNLYFSLYNMPTREQDYNSTIRTSAPGGGRWSADKIDKELFFWNSQFEPNWSPVQGEELLEDTQVCSVYTVYDECVTSEACFWDFDEWDCKPSPCNAFQELVPDKTLEQMTGGLKDFRETHVRTKSCQRMKGCAIDPITHTCGPDPNRGFPVCKSGYTMANSYMNKAVCKPGYTIVGGSICAENKNLHCPWGVDTYKASFERDGDLRRPEPEGLNIYRKMSYSYPDIGWKDELWGTEYHRFKSSQCRPFDIERKYIYRNAGIKWHWASTLNGDNSLRGSPSGDQGTDVKCMKNGATTYTAHEERPHVAGEYSAANRAFCSALQDRYNVCDIHFPGKDFVCITLRDECVLRYMTVESISTNNIQQWVQKVVYNPDIDDVDVKLMGIYDYTDKIFDKAAEGYLTMYFTEGDMELMPGLKDKVLTGAQIQERFEEYYFGYFWKNLTGYAGFNDDDNWPKYEPDYEIVEIEVLDLLALKTEMIGKMDSDIHLDVLRCALAEIFTNTYFTWREIQMAAVNEQIDAGLHILIAAETSMYRTLFWDFSDYYSKILNYVWSQTFVSDDEYIRTVDSFLDDDIPVADHNGLEALARGYMEATLSDEYLASKADQFVSTLDDQHEKGTFLGTYHYADTVQEWVHWVDDILDRRLLYTRFDFDIETTVDFFYKRFGGTYVDVEVFESRYTWDIVKKRPNYSPYVQRSKVMKKTSVLVPFSKRSKIVKNHLELGVQKLWVKLPKKPPTAPIPPKLKPLLPVPEPLKINKFKKITHVDPAKFDAIILETFKPPKAMRTDIWIPGRAGFNNPLSDAISKHTVALKDRFKTSFKLHKMWAETSGKKILESKLLKRANAKQMSEIKKSKRLSKAREKLIQQIKLKNQLIALDNAKALQLHNLATTKFNKVMGAFDDSKKVFQRPLTKVSQTVDYTTSSGLAVLKTRIPKVIAQLKFTKESGSITQVATKTNKLVKVLKVWKQSKLGLAIKYMGKAFKMVFAVLGWVDFAVTIMEVYQSIQFLLDNPRGCSKWDDFLSVPTDPIAAVIDIFNPPKFALRFRTLVLQDVDGYSKEMTCAERLSWGMFNADGKYGLADYRYNVPYCARDVNYRQLDVHFSDAVKGLNGNCNRDSHCRRATTIGRCVYNRCVYPAHFIGMKMCKRKVDLDLITLSEPLHREEYVRTDYDYFHTTVGLLYKPKKKYIVDNDEMSFGKFLLDKCNGAKFAEYRFLDQSTEGIGHIECFDDCDAWITNKDHNRETWMLTMLPANETRSPDVDEYCTESTDCDTGGICSSDHKCTPPIDCYTHRHCYGGYYLPGRLPMCHDGTCVDICTSDCSNIDECVRAATYDCAPPPPTANPTPEPTVPPTNRPTPEPTTAAPTPEPTELATPPPFVPPPPPTLQPSASPTPSPTASPTLAPVTPAPTKSPTEPGVFAGSECEMNVKVDFTLCRGDDNTLYMADIDSVEEVLTETSDYSTCESACKNTEECRYLFVQELQGRSIKCIYFHTKAEPYPSYIAVRPPPGIIGCFEKQIPCIPTAAPTGSPTASPTKKPTVSPTTAAPTDEPTAYPTAAPTTSPTNSPTDSPTTKPTNSPTETPTVSPTVSPTTSPTTSPTVSPTTSPTDAPTSSPTVNPTASPTTPEPTLSPTLSPTSSPTTSAPTTSPTTKAPTHPGDTNAPTAAPTASPTDAPTVSPTDAPTDSPTASPTESPTAAPTASPTDSPTESPTAVPTVSPTDAPTDSPTASPTDSPTDSPTASPTTGSPTDSPTGSPTTLAPTNNPTTSPTGSPTSKPTTPAPTFDVSVFDVKCEYSTINQMKLGVHEQFAEVYQVDIEMKCMEECDTDVECDGFQYEPIARKCILFKSYSSLISYSRATVFRKTNKCPVTNSPTKAPTIPYEPQFLSVPRFCHYDELPGLYIEGGSELATFTNTSVAQCVEYCDTIPVCSYIKYDNASGFETCLIYPDREVVDDVYVEGIVWFNKTDVSCIITDTPTASPTPAPTTTCNYTEWENSAIGEYQVLSGPEIDAGLCRHFCDFNPTCVGFVVSSANCTLFTSMNETTITTQQNSTLYGKADESCVQTSAPTTSPTTAAPTTVSPTFAPSPGPTRSPVVAPTDSPTDSPTTAPTAAPTETVLCDYARLPNFRPRIDAIYITQHQSHNHSIPHTEMTCKLSCDRSTKCIAFSHNTLEESCTFYDIVGPIEFSTIDPVVLFIKSRACIIPHAIETRGCVYTERPGEHARSGWESEEIQSISNVTEVGECSSRCDNYGTCRIFDYNSETSECLMYRAVTAWVIDEFHTGYVKNDPYCVEQLPPTGSPTSTPTTAPTSAPTTDQPTAPITCTPVILSLIIVYSSVACLLCLCLCCVPARHDDVLYVDLYAIVPDSITYTIEF